jgi:hypothetical protein
MRWTDATSALSLGFLETRYADYLKDPESVPEELRREFEVLARGDAFARDGRRGPSFGLPLPPPGKGDYEDREDDSPGLAVL